MRGEGVKGHRVHRVIHRAHERCAVVPPLGEVERHHLPGRVHALVRPARAPNGHGPPADLFKRLLELARDDRADWVVHVRPELVVEIAFDGVQRSTRYPGGVTLRFARVLRHRPDKRAEEADTLAAVLAVRAE